MSGTGGVGGTTGTNGAHGASSAGGPSQTVGTWLDTLDPAPPPALVEKLRTLLGGHLARPLSDVPNACLAAGEGRLAELLGEGSTNRHSALDLLAIDALVTYAFEAAADQPTAAGGSPLEALADDAMVRISRIPSQGSD